MSRKTWMDRTLETAREADVRMPWSRRPVAEETPVQTPAARAVEG